jgi:hypothetical protein
MQLRGLTVSLVLLSTSIYAAAPAGVPDDWVPVEGIDFRIWAPPGTQFEGGQGIDTLGGNFTGETFKLFMLFGWYNPNYEGALARPELSPEKLVIDGKEAIFINEPAAPDEADCEGRSISGSYLVEDANASPPPEEEPSGPKQRIILGSGRMTLWIGGCSSDPETIGLIGRIIRTAEFPPYE